jgi:hypothetical protein
MDDAMNPGEEERPRPRPRVVDKRVSARAEADEAPAPQPPPVETPPPSAPRSDERRAAPPAEPPPGPAPPAAPEAGDEALWTPEQEAEARRFAQQVVETPSRDWVLNTAVTLANVAAAKLEAGLVEDSQVAIDALAGIVDSAGPGLGDAESPLRQTLAQLRMAFAQGLGPPAPPSGP